MKNERAPDAEPPGADVTPEAHRVRWSRWDLACIPLAIGFGLAGAIVAGQGRSVGIQAALIVAGFATLIIAVVLISAWWRGKPVPLARPDSYDEKAASIAVIVVWILVGVVLGVLDDLTSASAMLYSGCGGFVALYLGARLGSVSNRL